MPCIDLKVSVSLSDAGKQQIISRLGKAISAIPGKSESWLMVAIADGVDLYFKGRGDVASAYVEVKIYGSADGQAFSALTRAICDILSAEAGIAQDRVFVSYFTTSHWGWNGANF